MRMSIRKSSRVLVYGVLSLSVVSVVSRVFRALTTIIIARFLGPANYGLFGLTLSLIGLFSLALSTLGIGSAIIKFVSQYNAEGRPDLVRRIVLIGLKIKTALSLSTGALIFVIAPFIARELMNLPQLTILIQISVIYYIATHVGFVQAVFKGYKKFHVIALFTAFERILYFGFTVFVLFSGLGLIGVAIGNAATYAILAGVALIVVFTKYIPKSKQSNNKEIDDMGLIKKMITYGAPVAIGDLIRGFFDDFITLYLGAWTAAASVGLFGAARSALNFIFLTPLSFIAAVLFPLASELYSTKKTEDLRRFLSLISKYALFFTSYLAIFTWFFTPELITIIYSTEFEASALYLQILIFLAISAAWTGLTGNVLLGAGYSKLTLKLNVIYVIAGLALALLIIPVFGVIGMCLLLVFLQSFIVLPLNVIYTKRVIGDFLELRTYLRGVPAILLSLVFIFFSRSFIELQLTNIFLSLLFLFSVFSLGFLLFGIALCFTGGIRRSEILSLNEILLTSPMAWVLRPLTLFLNFLGKFTRS